VRTNSLRAYLFLLPLGAIIARLEILLYTLPRLYYYYRLFSTRRSTIYNEDNKVVSRALFILKRLYGNSLVELLA